MLKKKNKSKKENQANTYESHEFNDSKGSNKLADILGLTSYNKEHWSFLLSTDKFTI